VRKFLLATAALVAAVAIWTVVNFPPAHATLETPFSDATVAGIVHVHTNRSDGRGSADEVAAAAARAGLKFVVFTDHGDATRTPDPPTYRSGVLCLDAVEISTTGGHYLALDMPAAPYPLGGDARDVVEDVKRLGGFGVVAHPESPKPALRWQAWDEPFDAIEWMNPDTSWRVRLQGSWRSRLSVVEALASYPFRSEETIARLLGGTALQDDLWHSIARRRRVVVLAGADAHENLALANGDPIDNRFSLPVPGYETSFRTMSVHVRLERQLSGDAAADAVAIMKALRSGHAYVTVDGLATPAAFQFTASTARATAVQGDELIASGPVTLNVRSNAPTSYTTTLWQDDRVVASVQDRPEISWIAEGTGVYRVVISAASKNGTIPWVISNPIYVGGLHPPQPKPERPVLARRALFDGRTSTGWWTETAPSSIAALEVPSREGGAELRLRYALFSGSSSGPYVTLAVNTPIGEPFRRLTFTARSERPLRMRVQLRVPGNGDRWQRSVYLDETDRQHTVEFDDMTPIGVTRTPRPALDAVRDLMFAIDTTHAKPGSSGRIWFTSVELTR
jgi:hypothetical protein